MTLYANRTRTRPATFVTLCLLLAACAQAIADTTRLIQLRYADAHEVSRTLRGMLEPGASVRVYQNRLVISASPAHQEQLLRVINMLDSEPRNLLISVKQPGQYESQRGKIAVSGGRGGGTIRTTSNPGGTVTETRTTVTTQVRRVSASDTTAQSVRTLEGHDTYIRIGSMVPYTYITRDRYDRLSQTTRYQDVDRGFWANARLSGDRVVLDIRTRKDQARGQAIDVQHVDTQVTGGLGQWIAIGQLAEADDRTSTGILSYGAASSSRSGTVYLKVELLD